MPTFRAFLTAAGGALISLSLAVAGETNFWVQNDRSDFEKATLRRLSMRSDGRLTLAPALRELLDSSTPYLWTLAADSKGNVYAGGGGPGGTRAKVFAIDRAGKSRTLAELDGLEVHALALDRQDRVYAATVPDGKIYRLDPAGKSEVFYDPKAKYIWAMAFAPSGDLYVATGDQGEIHRVTPDGKGSVFFKTEETHARSVAVDTTGNLIVGTEPGGLILRVTPAGDGFVLYQAPKREITAVAVASNGAIYAAAVGNKIGSSAPVPPPAPPPAPAGEGAPTSRTAGVQRVTAPPPPTLGTAPAVAGGSEIYRIDPDGYTRKVWSNTTDVAYALAFDGSGRALVGTGNKGNIYRIDSEVSYTLLLSAAPTQVTGFANGPRNSVYAATGNIGKVYQIGPEFEKDGVVESDTFDATFFSYWGRLIYHGEAAGGKLTFETRTGNLDRPQKNWSAWAPLQAIGGVSDGGRITSPPARFVQWKATLSAASNGASPNLDGVEVAYLSKNVPPQIDAVESTPQNYKFPVPTLNITPAQTLTLPPMGQRRRSSSSSVSVDTGQTLTYQKGWIGARWSASDPNGDSLIYKIEIKGVKETTWQLLKDRIRDRYYGFDATAFPDGDYQVRVTASDSPSNAPADALTASMISDPFTIDNTPPQITSLTGSAAGSKITVKWRARDRLSALSKAEYSVNGGDWTVVEPTTRLTDSPEHEYTLVIDRPGSGEVTIAVRVADEVDNQAVEKVVVR